MSDEGAIKEIERLTLESAKIVEVNGISHSTASLKPIIPEFRPAPMVVSTLSALAQYLMTNPDKIATGQVIVHIRNPGEVDVMSPIGGIKNERSYYLRAESKLSDEFPFGKFMTVEEMTIKLRTMFVPSEELAEIVQVLTRVDVTNGLITEDDGISQSVTVKKGISGALTEKKVTKGIYKLSPYRTFEEVEQPKREYLFRLKDDGSDGPLAALFSAGGNQWMLQAVNNIRDWLVETIPKDVVILA